MRARGYGQNDICDNMIDFWYNMKNASLGCEVFAFYNVTTLEHVL